MTRAVDPGLLTVLREDIVPRLLADSAVAGSPPPVPAPAVPAAAAAGTDPTSAAAPRFTLIFDREGYSPAFFADLKALHIAILCYHKFPGADWPLAEFAPHALTLVHGEEVTTDLAERGTCLPNGLWLREVRRRGADGTQAASSRPIITPAPWARSPCGCARGGVRKTSLNTCANTSPSTGWLVEHGVAPLPETTS